jgi:RND family efflux transporter MFP subunit
MQRQVQSLQTQVSAADDDASAADADASAADAQANAAQAEVASLQVNLGNLTIPSPIDGMVTTKPAQVGDVVTPATALVEITDFGSLLVETDVPEAKLHFVKPGGPAEIILDAYPDHRYRGAVVDLVPKLNRAKATGTVKVRFVDDAEGVLPEMAARTSFLQKPLDEAQMKQPPKTVVPADAVVDRGGSKQVFVVVDGDKVRMVPVTLGPPFAGGFELVQGPTPGTKLVKAPPATMADGQPIKEQP